MNYEYSSKKVNFITDDNFNWMDSERFKDSVDGLLHTMGASGWEFIQIVGNLAIFKRPLVKKEKELLVEDTHDLPE